MEKEFFSKRKVLITGHNGFKGTWMCQMLLQFGAEVHGISIEEPTIPSLAEICKINQYVNSNYCDIRDFEKLNGIISGIKPDIVIHMAAQPLVRKSYQNPRETYETNVMGTVNLLESIRQIESVRSVVNVTTDKVYLNREWDWGYRENEELNGHDPYSNSKSCSELVTSSFIKSFFFDRNTAVSTARAGNVIGGGDFAKDRIIPDCILAAHDKKDIIVRNPYSTRPYQHVLEPVMAYLMIAMEQYQNKEKAGSYNVGPDDTDCRSTGELVNLFCESWKKRTGQTVSWINQHDGGPHEANFLKLDCSKIKKEFGWRPRWNVETAMDKIVEWTLAYYEQEDIQACMANQIKEYCD